MDMNTAITAERDRLAAERQAIQSQITDSTVKLQALDRELAAISAYEAAKSGKTVSPGGGTANTRARRGSRRQAILNVLLAKDGPMKRDALLRAFGVKGDKAGEMSISNALTALVKTAQIVRVDDGYKLAA